MSGKVKMTFLNLLWTFLGILEKVILRLPRRVSAHYLALKFLFRLALDVYTGVSGTHTILPTTPPVRAKVFRPGPPDHGRSPTYVVIHGLAVSGFDDARVLQLSKALCGTGAIVVTPQLDGLRACEISSARVREIADVAEAVAKDITLCPSGGVAVVSACVTAGFALVAATRTRTIAHALCIGTHASIRHVLAHCLSTQGVGGSLYAIEAGLLSSVARKDPELQSLFHASLADDHLLLKGTDKESLPSVMERYPRAAKIYNRIMGDFSETRAQLQKGFEEEKLLCEEVSPIRWVRDMKCRSVTMVHSSSDGIVPPYESRLLYQAFRKENPKVKAVMRITSLLDHGDKKPFDVSVLPELLTLVKTFSNFFRYTWE